eukprot:CAMPEP_0172940852 /NCGR_PEP_ID=MMETSP1075-20121228/224248_1 /TAXON_ID=2916 /ORGANISM="Ceratium fusus, Strain PA161109" /LENGTH=138 /DNA_ID=CAMNT_0013802261 /DNA_START=588 /DNA_END=1002 /DNA_ORIENTATION=-
MDRNAALQAPQVCIAQFHNTDDSLLEESEGVVKVAESLLPDACNSFAKRCAAILVAVDCSSEGADPFGTIPTVAAAAAASESTLALRIPTLADVDKNGMHCRAMPTTFPGSIGILSVCSYLCRPVADAAAGAAAAGCC